MRGMQSLSLIGIDGVYNGHGEAIVKREEPSSLVGRSRYEC